MDSKTLNKKIALAKDTPLCDISVAISDAKGWIKALLKSLT